jgi:hypothetical protein
VLSAGTADIFESGFTPHGFPFVVLVAGEGNEAVFVEDGLLGVSSSRFGHFAPKLGCWVAGDGWQGDVGV